MPKRIRLIFFFILLFFTFFFPKSRLTRSLSTVHAASPGLNIINYASNAYHVPDNSLKSGPNSWMVYIPNHPSELNPSLITANNVVVRIHATWTETGQQMLGTPSQQQQIAQEWCSSINSFAQSGKNIYIEPFNELEHDYERLSPQGTLDLSTAISRAQNFISILRSCTSITVTSPALDPQSADFSTTSSAFSNFNIISCHPYRMDTLERCKAIANGKQLIFTEIGVDKSGVKYDDCEFIEFFCDEGFIEALQNTPNLIAYFLFTVSPGNYTGSWRLTSPSVVKALKNECTGLTCNINLNQQIAKKVQAILSQQHLGKRSPFLERDINPGTLGNTAGGLLDRLLSGFNFWWVKYFISPFSRAWPFHYTSSFTEQYAENNLPQSGAQDSDTLYNIQQPPALFIQNLNTLKTDPKISTLVKHSPQIENNAPDFRQSTRYFGVSGDQGDIFGLYEYPPFQPNQKEKSNLMQKYFKFKSGLSSRVLPKERFSDTQVNDLLCRLACSTDSECMRRNPKLSPVFDAVISYLHVTEDNFKTYFPNGAPPDIDRSQAENIDHPIEIRISNFFCHNPNAVSLTLAKCSKYGPINSNVCRNTPDWMQQESLEGFLYGNCWSRLRQYAIAEQNHPDKAFLEICQKQNSKSCSSGNLLSQKIHVNQDFCHLSVDKKTQILDQENGSYSKTTDQCYACRTISIYFPNLTRTENFATVVNQQTTPLKSHNNQNSTNQTSVIDINYNNIETFADDDPKLGMGVAGQDYDPENRNLIETALSWFESINGDNQGCEIHYSEETETDSEGNTYTESVPQNSCQVSIESKVKLNLCITDKILNLYQNSNNFTSHFTPYQANQTIKQVIKEETDSDTPITSMQVSYAAGNGLGGRKSAKQMHDEGIDLSGESYTRNIKPVNLGPKNTIGEDIAKQYFTPASWQL